MKRILLAAGAALLALYPAALAVGGSTFTHSEAVRLPSQVVVVDGNGGQSKQAQADDKGGLRNQAQAGDDNGGQSKQAQADDKGGPRTPAQPDDHKGGLR